MAVPLQTRGLDRPARRSRATQAASYKLWRAWSRWLIHLSELVPWPGMFARHRRVAAAARTARAALDHLPPPSPPAPDPGPLANWSLLAPPSLHFAAHLLVVALVATVILLCNLRLPTLAIQQPVEHGPVQAFSLDPQVAPALSPLQVPDSASADTPAVRSAFRVAEPAFDEFHQLQEGETLGALAARYGVDVQSLFWANDLDKSDLLAVGQELRVPRISGLAHIIAPGETLESLAKTFGVTPEALVLLRSNGLRPGTPLPVGREIFIPGAVRPYPDAVLARFGGEQGIAALQAVTAAAVREGETSLRIGPGRSYDRVTKLASGRQLKPVARYGEWIKVEAGAAGSGWVRADLLALPAGVVAQLPETSDFPALPPRWVWPARGVITSPFGWRSAPFRSFHDGLDIANRARTSITAARAGRVIEAGWCRGFGYCVKLDHGEGLTTIYGHLFQQPSVSVGAQVEAGDPIGLMGSTFDRSGGGYSTGVHLHFTVKLNGQAVDPLKFLP